MATKKYISLDKLAHYDDLIKQEIASKADSQHTHSEYYTEAKVKEAIESSVADITESLESGEVTAKEAEHATSSDNATNAETAKEAEHATNADNAVNADSATKASQDGDGKVISDTYETKEDANKKLAEAKQYADSVKNDLLNGAGDAYDTLQELGDLIDENKDALDALEDIATGKADAEHTHEIEDITNLQTTLDGKAASVHTHTVEDIENLTSTVTELNYMSGVTANVQTQLDNKSDITHTHDDATTEASGLMTPAMVRKLSGIAEGATNITIDTSLSSTSENPVQNKVVNSAFGTVAEAIKANIDSISNHTESISNLQTAIGAFEEITYAEIDEIFENLTT